MNQHYMDGFPIQDIDFSVVTHIVAGSADVAPNGTMHCDPRVLLNDTSDNSYLR